jgi:hypothetical protein
LAISIATYRVAGKWEMAVARKAAGKKPTQQGVRFSKRSGWNITATKGTRRRFKGTCLGTINIGGVRIVLFSVPK